MSRPIFAISSGLLVGAGFGFLLVAALALLSPRESWTGSTSYPTLARRYADEQPVTQDVWQYIRSDPQARFQLFLGLLLGSGFGALTGAAVNIRSTIARAILMDERAESRRARRAAGEAQEAAPGTSLGDDAAAK
jgi:hypothetical protein